MEHFFVDMKSHGLLIIITFDIRFTFIMKNFGFRSVLSSVIMKYFEQNFTLILIVRYLAYGYPKFYDILLLGTISNS